MIIDQLIVAFKADGAKELLSTIDTISKKVVSATNKAIMEEAKLENIRARTAKTKKQEKLIDARIENANISTLQKEYNFEKKAQRDKEQAQKKTEQARKKEIGEMHKNHSNQTKADRQHQKELEKRAREIEKQLEAQEKAERAKEEEQRKYEEEKEKARKKALVQSQKEHAQRDKEKAKREKEYQKSWEKNLAQRDKEEARQAKARQKEIEQRQKAEERAIKESILATKLKIAGTASLIYGIGKTAFGAFKWTENKALNLTRRVASYTGTGMTPSQVEGLEASLGRWGGQMGEGISTVRGLNAQLGAMTFGDTSLVENLGRFGIGGIGTQSTPIDVLKAVMRRVQTLGKDSKEAFALMSSLGFSDSMMKIMQSGDEKALEKEGVALSISEKILKTNEESFKAQQDIAKATEKIVEQTNFIRDIKNLLVKQFPEAASSLGLIKDVGGDVAMGAMGYWFAKNLSKYFSPKVLKSTMNTGIRGTIATISRHPAGLAATALGALTYASWQAGKGHEETTSKFLTAGADVQSAWGHEFAEKLISTLKEAKESLYNMGMGGWRFGDLTTPPVVSPQSVVADKEFISSIGTR